MFSFKELSLFFIFSCSFYFKDSYQANLKPFQFQCYSREICTWPLEYCSSEKYERRCIPCFRSVCRQRLPPLQCQYNCSLSEVKGIRDVNSGESSFVIPLVIVASLLVFVSMPVIYLLGKYLKLKKSMKAKEQKNEEMMTLIDSLQQDRKRENQPRENECYGKNKLTDINPTDNDSRDSYKPTAYRHKTLPC